LKRNRFAAASLGVIVAAALVLAGAIGVIRRNNAAIRIRPPPAWTPSRGPIVSSPSDPQPLLQLDAPHEREHVDSGAAEAARKLAIPFVTGNLKVPESAEFPEDAVTFERLTLLNQTTGGRIEHWYVVGAVDSRNDYGVRVRSQWRIMLARQADRFFPVMAQLDDFEIYRMRGHVEMLAEARRAAWQERELQAASQKSGELAANRAVWQAIDAAKPAEEKARAALKLASDLLAAGRAEPARRRLQDVIDKYPATQAAGEAEEMLAEGK